MSEATYDLLTVRDVGSAATVKKHLDRVFEFYLLDYGSLIKVWYESLGADIHVKMIGPHDAFRLAHAFLEGLTSDTRLLDIVRGPHQVMGSNAD